MTRFGWVMTTYSAVLVIGVTALFHPAPKLIWNASASVPIGLYAVHPAGALRTDELLVVTLPEKLATFLDARRKGRLARWRWRSRSASAPVGAAPLRQSLAPQCRSS